MKSTQTWAIGNFSPYLTAGDYSKRRRTKKDHWGVRVIIVVDGGVVLVRHQERETGNSYWLFPGGGIEIGETVVEAGEREVKEETNLDVHVEELVYIREALPGEIEFYVTALGGIHSISLGYDPEIEEQVLVETDLIPLSTLQDKQRFILYPRTIQERLADDLVTGLPCALYLGPAE